jgi:hypothetical protein
MSNKNNKLINNFVFKTESSIINNNETTSYSTISNNLSNYETESNKIFDNQSEEFQNESDESESDENESDKNESDESESDENESDKNESDKNESDENESDENEIIENKSNMDTDEISELESYEYKKKKNNKSSLLESSDFNTELEDKLHNKYMKNSIKTKKIKEEIREVEKRTINPFDLGVIKNNLDDTKKNLDQGYMIYKNSSNNFVKICSNQNCSNLSKCSKDCYKNNLYKSLKNFNRGIKTIYNLLFKLILSYPIFRIQCKCCEKKEFTTYLNELDKNFIQEKKNINEGINNNLEPVKIMELVINFLINKFMSVIGVLDCECNFKNKYNSFYSHDYLNFSSTIKIYIRTIPQVISYLKSYWEIKDNHEELVLIDDSRCIHEDIRYNNLTYCIKKKYNTYNKKYYNELVMNLDLVNTWVIDSIKITNILYNQQSLEHFIYYFQNKPEQIDIVFDKIYNIQNQFLDINYVSNKKNIITIINDYYKNTNEKKIDKLLELLNKQLIYRNKTITNYNVPNILINYMIKSIGRNNKLLGFKLLKYIKNLKNINNNNQKNILNPKYLEIIFNELLDNSDMNIETKISYLKIINKY